jgi:hypothetical protein
MISRKRHVGFTDHFPIAANICEIKNAFSESPLSRLSKPAVVRVLPDVVHESRVKLDRIMLRRWETQSVIKVKLFWGGNRCDSIVAAAIKVGNARSALKFLPNLADAIRIRT